MKKTLCVVTALIMAFGLAGSKVNPVQDEKNVQMYEQIAPINRDAVIEKLMADKVITSNSTQDDVTKALKAYIGSTKNGQISKYEKKRDSLMEKKITAGLESASLNGNKLGQGNSNLEKATPIPFGTPQKTVKVLVLLGDFSDYKHNNIVKPDLSRTYWTKDFGVDHYQKLLFSDGYYTTPEGITSPTFKQYYKEQSNGNLNVEGKVFGWFTAPNVAKYYGADSDTSNNIHANQFITDITKQAVAKGVDLSQYDIEDPYDLDGDGNLSEPDGIVDHLMVIYAGLGQEAGGGALGDDAIWSHSSQVGLSPVLVDKKRRMSILDYTTEAENGAVGVFAHEFVHDLGIPDDYDTVYSADGDIVEYWSIMGGGSWSGAPGGTKPTGINPYSRILLGLTHGGNWMNWQYADYNNLTSGTLQLDTSSMNTGNTQAMLIKLPKDKNVLSINKPFAGVKEFWGGTGTEIDHSMTAKVDLRGKTTAALSYNIWYDIEENWDAGFVQVSEDGATWKSLATSHTVSTFNNPEGYPTIINSFPAYTGNSNGWLSEKVDLSAYAGKEIYIRFRYATDWGTELAGMYVDNVNVIADGTAVLSEGAENGFGSFTANGFELSDGSKYGNHYYVAEWRSHLGIDEGLKYNARAKIEYNQGLALWYINKNFSDNWVGVHPGYGQLGIVDAGQYTYLNSGLGNGNESGYRTGYGSFVQLHDAAFSLDKAADMNLSVYSWAKNPYLAGMQAEPLFDDANSYFSVKSPYSGLQLPKLGLKLRVLGNASDYSRGSIYLSK